MDDFDLCFIALATEAFAPTESGRVFAVWNTASLGLVEAAQLLDDTFQSGSRIPASVRACVTYSPVLNLTGMRSDAALRLVRVFP